MCSVKCRKENLFGSMYPNNELVKMGTSVIITKIIHRYSDFFATAEESRLHGTRHAVQTGRYSSRRSLGRVRIFWLGKRQEYFVSNAEWRHHVVENGNLLAIVIDLYKVEDESRSLFLGRLDLAYFTPTQK